MKRKILAMVLTAAMTASMLAGCGSSSSSSTDTSDKSDTSDSSSDTADTTTDDSTWQMSDDGDVLNIQVWNEEFKSRVEKYYPGYEADSSDTTKGKIGDVTVQWTITPSDDLAYQNNLDSLLPNNTTATGADKVDLFCIEADYALKYVNSDTTIPLSELGISDDDLSDQFDYTKDLVRDSDGQLKASSWQACSAGLIYNRAVAKDVLGTDDPDKVQEALSDWDKYAEVAQECKDKGYLMTATANDTYRVFSNNVSQPWVTDGKLTFDDNIINWINLEKQQVADGETTTEDLWSDAWNAGFMKNADPQVFCYFGPAWLINFSMANDDEGSIAHDGGWGFCVGPQSFYWGGTWICAANGTDNSSLVADIIKTMTTDQDVLSGILKNESDCVNSKTVLEKFGNDDSFGVSALGGQNFYKTLEEGAESINMNGTTSAYDQGCAEQIQAAMKSYFSGDQSIDDALKSFQDNISTLYPNITVELPDTSKFTQ